MGSTGAASTSNDRQLQTLVPFSGGHKLIPPSVCIISMQDPNVASATNPMGAGSNSCTSAGPGGRREPETDLMTMMAMTCVSCSTSAPPYHPCPSFHLSPPTPVCYGPVLKAFVIGALLLTLFSSQTLHACPPTCRHCDPGKVLISRLAP